MSDGLGMATFFQAFNDEYKHENLPAMRPISFPKQLLVWLISPFITLQIMASVMLSKKGNDVLKNGKPLTGVKTLGFSWDIHLPMMKKICKQKGCTLNDYCSSILSVSLFEWFSRQEQRDK